MNHISSTSIFVVDSSHQVSQPVSNSEVLRRRIKKNQQQPVVDVIVVLVALPTFTILALLLEASTRGNWLATTQSRFTVLGLGIALAVACLSIVMYITSRIGGKMWSGAIPSEPGSGPHFSYYNSRQTVDVMKDLPPSYEIVMRGFDIPPPAYHTIINESNAKNVDELDDCSKFNFNSIQHI